MGLSIGFLWFFLMVAYGIGLKFGSSQIVDDRNVSYSLPGGARAALFANPSSALQEKPILCSPVNAIDNDCFTGGTVMIMP